MTRLIETAAPEEAFAALADGTRIDILRALWDAEDHRATFSELRTAVGAADSGGFNYHLGELVDRFVRKTDDGYELTLAGIRVNGAIAAGAYTAGEPMEPIRLDETCPACDGAQTLHYEGERVRVDCETCELASTAGVPPGVFAGYDRGEIPAVADRYFRTILSQVGDGFCWFCEGRTDPVVGPLGEQLDEEVPAELAALPAVLFTCRRCGSEITADLGAALLDHPAVVAFHHEHGLDIRERPFWAAGAWDTDRTRFRERDPVRAELSYHAGGDTLTLVVDGELTVRESERD
jgi:DNA-binding transcriptional ArsR family regulator